MDNMLNEMTTTDISQHFDNDITLDPNHNYEKLHDHVKALRDICHCDTKSFINIDTKRING